MQRFLSFLKHHKQLLLLLYALIYWPWFSWLEQHVTGHYHILHVPFDDMIPFCEFFVIPYYLWFAYIAAGMLFIAFADAATCYRMAVFLITGMTAFLIISTCYPNGLDLRPETFPRENVFTGLVRTMYEADTPTNVLPSLHVYNSIGIHLALCATPRLNRAKWIRWISGILAVLIILSTVFIKQHSILDVIAACALAAVMYPVSYLLLPRLMQKIRSKKQSRSEIG